MANWTEDGRLIPDNKPVEVPLRFKQRETEAQRIAKAVTAEFSNQADSKGFETFEDAQDFEIEDDFDIFPNSQFEVKEMQEEFLPDIPDEREKTVEELALEELDNESRQQEIQSAKEKIIQEREAEEKEREIHPEPR